MGDDAGSESPIESLAAIAQQATTAAKANAEKKHVPNSGLMARIPEEAYRLVIKPHTGIIPSGIAQVTTSYDFASSRKNPRYITYAGLFGEVAAVLGYSEAATEKEALANHIAMFQEIAGLSEGKLARRIIERKLENRAKNSWPDLSNVPAEVIGDAGHFANDYSVTMCCASPDNPCPIIVGAEYRHEKELICKVSKWFDDPRGALKHYAALKEIIAGIVESRKAGEAALDKIYAGNEDSDADRERDNACGQ